MEQPSEADLTAASSSKSEADNRRNQRLRKDEGGRAQPLALLKGVIQMGLQRGYILKFVMGYPVPDSMQRQSEWVWPGLTMKYIQELSSTLVAKDGAAGMDLIMEAVARQPVREWPLWDKELLPWLEALVKDFDLAGSLLNSVTRKQILCEFEVGPNEFDSGGNRFPVSLDPHMPPGLPVYVFLNHKLLQEVFVNMGMLLLERAGVDYTHPRCHPLLHSWLLKYPRPVEAALKERNPQKKKRGGRRKGGSSKKSPARVKYEKNLKLLQSPWSPTLLESRSQTDAEHDEVKERQRISVDADGDDIPWAELDETGRTADECVYYIMGSEEDDWCHTWTTEDEVLVGKERDDLVAEKLQDAMVRDPVAWKKLMERWEAIRLRSDCDPVGSARAGASDSADGVEDVVEGGKKLIKNGVLMLSKEQLHLRRVRQAAAVLGSPLHERMMRERSKEREWMEGGRKHPMAHVIMVTRERNPTYMQLLYHLPCMSHEHIEAAALVGNFTRHICNVEHEVLSWTKDAKPILEVPLRQRQDCALGTPGLREALMKWGPRQLGEPFKPHVPRAIPWDYPIATWLGLRRSDLLWTINPQFMAELLHIQRQDDVRRLHRVKYNPDLWSS